MSTRFLAPPPRTTLADVSTRHGTLDDADPVVAMHARCSEESIYRRYHAPLPRLGPRLAHQLLAPPGGWSLVAEYDGRVVALACAGPLSATELELGLLVEDAEQHRGIGARLLREGADDAAGRGFRTLHCLAQPENDRVVTTANRAGLVARLSWTDGLLDVQMPLRRLTAPRPEAALRRPA
ncbi:MAG: N-acetyltransferase family protein [Nocardioidaceae bacterium]